MSDFDTDDVAARRIIRRSRWMAVVLIGVLAGCGAEVAGTSAAAATAQAAQAEQAQAQAAKLKEQLHEAAQRSEAAASAAEE
jgi:flagellar basal body L-ring protein FlgH